MQIRKFEARTMPEALRLVKSEFGSDAVILSTKDTNKGLGSFGLFGSPMVEVTAALDRNPSASFRNNGFPEKSFLSSETGYGGDPNLFKAYSEDVGSLRNEISDLKELISEMKEKRKEGNGKNRLPDGFEDLYSGMIHAGVVPQLSRMIIEKSAGQLQRYVAKGNDQTISMVKKAVAINIMDLVKVSGGIQLDEAKGRAVAFIGPTGVGKTTTLAKLAAQHSMKGKSVALITIDTYRVGAVEQFKTYAKILKAPVGVASTPRELKEKIKQFHDKDLILIDTAGRSHRDQRQISFLKEFFPQGRTGPQVHLLLSATTKDSDIIDIVKKFSALPVQRHLFTKLDECASFGSLLNVIARYKVPYSYFTTGQKVPEDLEIASPERVVDLILRINDKAHFMKSQRQGR